jgi:TrmH family RNA methyltransferase
VPAATRIPNRQHALVRRCRTLAVAPEGGDVLLDGAHLVREALANGTPLAALLTDGRHPDLAAAASRAGVPLYDGPPAVIAAASPVRTPNGVVAIARWAPASIDRVFVPAPALVVGLVDVQDPGNVGGVIRSADALEATGVLAIGETAAPDHWRTLRGSMGSVFRLSVARTDLSALTAEARARGCTLVASVARGGDPPPAIDWQRPAVVLVGREGAGLPAPALAIADRTVTIPMRTGVDSLNVAVAAALLVDVARRARHAGASAR